MHSEQHHLQIRCLFCPTFRAKSSGPVLVNFSRFFVDCYLILLEALVSFHQIFQSILVSSSHF